MTTAAITSISETTTTTETSVVTESFQEILSSAINSPVKETDKLEIIISAVGNKARRVNAGNGLNGKLRRKLRRRAAHGGRHCGHTRKGEHHCKKRPVQRLHPVDLKACAFGCAVAPGAHGVPGHDAALQRPVRQGGQGAHSAGELFFHGAVLPRAEANGLSRTHDLPRLADKAGDHPQHHHQQQ